jgi:integrase/recombinase XerD
MTPLRRRMIEDMQIRNLAQNTQDAYVEQVERFARYFRKSPERLGPPEIRAWQLHLAQDRHLAASSIAVAVAALRFLYVITLRRPWDVNDEIPAGRQSKPLPEVLSPEEVAAFLGAVKVPKQGVRHRTGRIARFMARKENTVMLLSRWPRASRQRRP